MVKNNMKYAFLIPSGQQMVPALLFQQWVPFQEWLAKNEDGKIFSMMGSNQTESRNKLLTQGNQTNPHEFAKTVEWFILIDADIKFSLSQMQELMYSEEKFVSGWYIFNPNNQTSLVGYWKDEPTLLSPEKVLSHKEIFEVDHVAGGFMKIHSSLVQQLEFPFYYVPKIERPSGDSTWVAEDLIFARNVYEKTGIKPKVIPTLKVGHVKWVTI